MARAVSFRTAAAALVFWLAASAAQGQDWARAMFDHTSHDFGTVARGTDVRHTFVIQNIYEEDAHIADARSTCGCTTAKFPSKVLKTWEKADVVAVVDTRAFDGQKDATLTVVLDKPFPAEVQLHVHAYIRRDVVVQPGTIQFGNVDQGASLTQKVAVEYAGRSDWRVLKVECANPHLEAKAVETSRGPTQVAYELQVTLKGSAPVGYIRDQVFLVTNDLNPRAVRVPVPVEGIVAAAITAQPSPLSGIVVAAGDTVTERLIVRGKAPFKIQKATCGDPRFQCNVIERAKNLYLVEVTFKADQQPGKVQAKIRIETDQGGSVVEVPVELRITPRGPVAF